MVLTRITDFEFVVLQDRDMHASSMVPISMYSLYLPLWYFFLMHCGILPDAGVLGFFL